MMEERELPCVNEKCKYNDHTFYQNCAAMVKDQGEPYLPFCRKYIAEGTTAQDMARSINMDQHGKVCKWRIEPHPYSSEYDYFVTDDDLEALEALKDAAENYLWDQNDGDDDGPYGATRVLSVTHCPSYNA